MAKYPFLSDEWIDAAKALRDDFEGDSSTPHQVKMNLNITGAPFTDEAIQAHMDSSSGDMQMDKGHIDGQDLTVTVDYDTAKAIFVEGNPQAGMQAFMAGKIKVEGDMTKMMAMQSAPPSPGSADLAAKIAEITE